MTIGHAGGHDHSYQNAGPPSQHSTMSADEETNNKMKRAKSAIAVAAGGMTVGGGAHINTTGKGERLSTLLEVIGVISALILGVAVEGFAGIGQDEFDYLGELHGEDYMKEQKMKFCLSIMTVGVLCIIVLFSVVTLYVFFTHQHKEIKEQEDWVIWLDAFKVKLVFVEILFFCEFLSAGFALSYVATFKLFLHKEEDAFLLSFINMASGGAGGIVLLFFAFCAWSFGRTVDRIIEARARREGTEVEEKSNSRFAVFQKWRRKRSSVNLDTAPAARHSSRRRGGGGGGRGDDEQKMASPRVSAMKPSAHGPGMGDVEELSPEEQKARLELMQTAMKERLAAERVRTVIQNASDCSNLKALFNVVDKDADGHITMQEFGAFVDGCVAGKEGAVKPSEADITTCYKYVDLDSNGTIEFDEFEYFLQYSQSQCYGRIRECIVGACGTANAEALFKTVDTDGDGSIAPIEFRAFVEGCVAGYPGGHEPVAPADVDATFKYIDTSGDGSIEFDEFEYFFFVRKK